MRSRDWRGQSWARWDLSLGPWPDRALSQLRGPWDRVRLTLSAAWTGNEGMKNVLGTSKIKKSRWLAASIRKPQTPKTHPSA